MTAPRPDDTADDTAGDPVPADLLPADLSPDEYGRILEERHGRPAFHAEQILAWVWQRSVFDPARMTDLSKDLRADLGGPMDILGAEAVSARTDPDGTLKVLVRLRDGRTVETVMIPEGDRRTACISTQVGCPVGCVFCASGLDGVERSLTAGEIAAQVALLNRALADEAGAERSDPGPDGPPRINSVVVMGMGEPLLNRRGLEGALDILSADWGLGLGRRRITVSTSGVRGGIEWLETVTPHVNLAVSLHAPDSDLRRELVPLDDAVGGVDVLVAEARHYFETTGREVTFEYVLLGGVNDTAEHAHRLADLVTDVRCMVNLIPYNPVAGLDWRRPERDAVERFAETLGRRGVLCRVRRTRGLEIDAACGQLRRRTGGVTGADS